MTFKIGDKVKYLGITGWEYGTVVKAPGTMPRHLNPDNVWAVWHKEGETPAGTPTYVISDLVEYVTPPFQLEVGKTYLDDSGNKVKVTKIVYVTEGGKVIYYWPDGTPAYSLLESKYKIVSEYKPEDWRALHYVNEIASLGRETHQSEEEVKEKFKDSPGFIKAVRVDA